MPKGPDVPPRVLILIAVAAVLGLFLVLNPFGGDEEPVTPAAPPVAEEKPSGSGKPPANTTGAPASGDAEGRQGKAPAPSRHGGGGGGEGGDPQEQYLDCVAAADDRKEIRACEEKVYGG
jgi:hypothetical protein